MPRRIVLVHYHLRPGGVTSVIRDQARGLLERHHEVLVVAGESPGEDWPRDIATLRLPGLAYRETTADSIELEKLSDELRRAAGEGGVLLFHNAHVGKSPVTPELIDRMALSGQPMLLQAHDFAEDGRWNLLENLPERGRWYPHGDHIRWLVLNHGDAAALRDAGVGGVECIANPVSAPRGWEEAKPRERHALYPTRGLRRKNLGEFLLLAALAPGGWTFATTSRPDSGPQSRCHDRWERWTKAMDLPVRLADGWTKTRPAWCMSTSMQEGFGLAAAEPWAAGIPSTGRWLPRATGHWFERGWQTPAAYLALSIPSEWIDRRQLAARVARELGKEVDAPETREVMECHFAGPRVDFGRLPETFQREAMRRAKSGQAGECVFHGQANGTWTPRQWFALLEEGAGDALPTNRELLASWFSKASVASTLSALADAAASALPRLHGYGSPSMVLESFSRPENFHFLRSLP